MENILVWIFVFSILVLFAMFLIFENKNSKDFLEVRKQEIDELKKLDDDLIRLSCSLNNLTYFIKEEGESK